ncbi:MAG TPA: hypothetical protein VMZ74_08065 [Ramlibacter sp.]|nr:hypothetical protein [Ramlibacter sp.]
MKSILTKGVLAAAASLAIAGAFAQVQTGEPSPGSKLGVTPPPSTSTTTDTSRLSSDCSKVAERQRSHQAGGDQLGANCGNTTTMGATGTAAAPATVGSTTASTTTTPSSSGSTGTAMPSDTGSTNVASSDMGSAPKHKAKKAKADRG